MIQKTLDLVTEHLIECQDKARRIARVRKLGPADPEDLSQAAYLEIHQALMDYSGLDEFLLHMRWTRLRKLVVDCLEYAGWQLWSQNLVSNRRPLSPRQRQLLEEPRVSPCRILDAERAILAIRPHLDPNGRFALDLAIRKKWPEDVAHIYGLTPKAAKQRFTIGLCNVVEVSERLFATAYGDKATHEFIDRVRIFADHRKTR